MNNSNICMPKLADKINVSTIHLVTTVIFLKWIGAPENLISPTGGTADALNALRVKLKPIPPVSPDFLNTAHLIQSDFLVVYFHSRITLLRTLVLICSLILLTVTWIKTTCISTGPGIRLKLFIRWPRNF